jgi:curli biogenesis system outer membrane secretion channel CsgG
MKSFGFKIILLMVVMFASISLLQAQTSKVRFETIKEKCKGIPRDKRVRITVPRFSVSSRAAQASGQFGEELTAIMTNAIQECDCFRILESLVNKKDLADEIGHDESGATNGSGPKRGQQLGAQAIVTAEITEYIDGESTVGALGFKIGTNKAKLGLIIKVIDPQTREILWSKSIAGEAKKSGFKGFSFGNIQLGGSSKLSEAMSGAVEELVLHTVEALVKEKDTIFSQWTGDATKTPEKWTAENCKMVKMGNAPKVMVVVPETHLNAPLPNSASETVLLQKFLEAGFKVVDPAVLATISNQARFRDAIKDPTAVVALGKEFGAEIVIFGEGVSEVADKKDGITTCRARVDVKAVRTDNAEMLATHGAQAGGQGIAELTGAKTALETAGGQIADYLLGKFCAAGFGEKPVAGETKITGNQTTINVTNVNYLKLKPLEAALKAHPKVKDFQRDFKEPNAVIIIIHEDTTSDIEELIGTRLATQFAISGSSKNKIELTAK